jgi:hypothetical protein
MRPDDLPSERTETPMHDNQPWVSPWKKKEQSPFSLFSFFLSYYFF